MGTGSPGSVWVLRLLNAEPDPGSIVGTTPGADHVYNKRVYRGKVGLTARSGSALRSHSGWTRARLDQDNPRLGQGTDGAGLAVAGCGNGGTGAGHG